VAFGCERELYEPLKFTLSHDLFPPYLVFKVPAPLKGRSISN
jgi:hypothetical protein